MQILTFGGFKGSCTEIVRIYVATKLNNIPSLTLPNVYSSQAEEHWKPSTQNDGSWQSKSQKKRKRKDRASEMAKKPGGK